MRGVGVLGDCHEGRFDGGVGFLFYTVVCTGWLDMVKLGVNRVEQARGDDRLTGPVWAAENLCWGRLAGDVALRVHPPPGLLSSISVAFVPGNPYSSDAGTS